MNTFITFIRNGTPICTTNEFIQMHFVKLVKSYPEVLSFLIKFIVNLQRILIESLPGFINYCKDNNENRDNVKNKDSSSDTE